MTKQIGLARRWLFFPSLFHNPKGCLRYNTMFIHSITVLAPLDKIWGFTQVQTCLEVARHPKRPLGWPYTFSLYRCSARISTQQIKDPKKLYSTLLNSMSVSQQMLTEQKSQTLVSMTKCAHPYLQKADPTPWRSTRALLAGLAHRLEFQEL